MGLLAQDIDEIKASAAEQQTTIEDLAAQATVFMQETDISTFIDGRTERLEGVTSPILRHSCRDFALESSADIRAHSRVNCVPSTFQPS